MIYHVAIISRFRIEADSPRQAQDTAGSWVVSALSAYGTPAAQIEQYDLAELPAAGSLPAAGGE